MRRAAWAMMLAIVSVISACSSDAMTADGVVTAIDTRGLGQVRSFTLRTAGGESLDFTIADPVDREAGGFPPDHLREHMALGESITVAYEVRAGERVVLKLQDAPRLDP